ncbi:MAG: hypothetical protein JXR76_19380 [Deltaproteobacteria bacterium]|nr:hypothetical protein [Deltaproteobacteria bacterium]
MNVFYIGFAPGCILINSDRETVTVQTAFMHLAVDFAWTGSDDPQQLLAGLHDAGAGVNGDSDSCFKGGFAHLRPGEFDDAGNTWLTTTQYDNLYYQTTLRNLDLLVAAGKFPAGASF